MHNRRLTGAGSAYGMFFATAVVCLIRGGFHWSLHFVNKAREEREAQQRKAAEEKAAQPVPAPAGDGRKAVPA